MIGLRRRDPMVDLMDILLAQRAALRSGNVQELGHLAPRLEKALARLRGAAVASGMSEVRRIAAENAELIKAAGAGVTAVRAMRRKAMTTQLSTYSADGRLTRQACPAGATLSRR